MVAGGRINNAHMGTLLPEFLSAALADAACTTGDDDDFILEYTNTAQLLETIIADF